jgi:RNA polymerase sigma factor (sigma-70 family)
MSTEDEPAAHVAELERRTTLHVRRAAAGDEESVAWVVSHFSPALLLQARYRLEQLPAGLFDPEDLVQDVWLTTLPRLPALPPRDGRYTPVLMRFLGTSLLNRCNTLAQKHLWGKPARVDAVRRDGADTVDPLQQLPADRSGVVSRACRSELSERVRQGIEELSAQDRELIVLRGIEQNSNRTVALLLGVPPGTVAMRYHRALQRLRKQLPRSVFDELE